MNALHIVIAVKPFEDSYGENAIERGVCGLNIDGTRIPLPEGDTTSRGLSDPKGWCIASKQVGSITDDWKKGRWPANILHDGNYDDDFPDTNSEKSAARFFKECKKENK